MKLNGWQRIGVVASVLWAIGAAIYERTSQVSTATEFYKNALSNCPIELYGACSQKTTETYKSLLFFDSVKVADIVFVAIGPVISGWILAYLTVKIVCWVKAGF